MTEHLRNEYRPDRVSPPGDTLAELLSDRGLTQAEFAAKLGMSKKALNEIVKGKAPITPETAIHLERALGLPAAFWSNLEREYRDHLARQRDDAALAREQDFVREFPYAKMAQYQWVRPTRKPAEKVRELCAFYGVARPQQLRMEVGMTNARYRRSAVAESLPIPVSAWLRAGERQGRSLATAPYDERRFRSALDAIRRLTASVDSGPGDRMQRLCADAGVAVVFVRELPKAPMNGACRWLAPDKALIQMSLRGRRDDIFWFSFFHEAAHVLLHSKKEVFVDGPEDLAAESDLERQADTWAADFLIPPPAFRRLAGRSPYSHELVESFAADLGIAPGIVVGRLQHEGLLPPTHLNGLKRRLEWGDVG